MTDQSRDTVFSMISRNWGLATAIVIGLGVLGWQIAGFWFVTDDACIAFRYAEHAAHGLGLVFNGGRDLARRPT